MGEYIKLYFQWHIILLVFLILSVIILLTDLGIKKKAKVLLGTIVGIIFLLTIVHTVERYVCEETNDYPDFRFFLTVIKYIGPQVILFLLICSILNKKKIEIVLLSIFQVLALVPSALIYFVPVPPTPE